MFFEDTAEGGGLVFEGGEIMGEAFGLLFGDLGEEEVLALPFGIAPPGGHRESDGDSEGGGEGGFDVVEFSVSAGVLAGLVAEEEEADDGEQGEEGGLSDGGGFGLGELVMPFVCGDIDADSEDDLTGVGIEDGGGCADEGAVFIGDGAEDGGAGFEEAVPVIGVWQFVGGAGWGGEGIAGQEAFRAEDDTIIADGHGVDGALLGEAGV
ncbi:MAG: hypothetical protein RI897_773 [Verrucomicrobiota bacterium]